MTAAPRECRRLALAKECPAGTVVLPVGAAFFWSAMNLLVRKCSHVVRPPAESAARVTPTGPRHVSLFTHQQRDPHSTAAGRCAAVRCAAVVRYAACPALRALPCVRCPAPPARLPWAAAPCRHNTPTARRRATVLLTRLRARVHAASPSCPRALPIPYFAVQHRPRRSRRPSSPPSPMSSPSPLRSAPRS